MKRKSIIVITIAVTATLMVLTHVALNANWPEILSTIHGG